MCLRDPHRRRLHRALELAREAAAFASPNPTVGCVLTSSEDTFLAEGAHFYDARDHAEIAALQQAASRGLSVSGATAFVTLEPCSHHGRTGPCADALIAAGIARCVIATQDPNPQVSGQGIARLRSAGVEVHLLDPAAPEAIEARRLNDAFAFAIRERRPFVTLKAALSADGFLAPPSETRSAAAAPHWITGPAARADVQVLRHSADALVTGIGTLLADNPSLTDRTGLARRRPLLRTILDPQLRTPVSAKLFQSADEAAGPLAAPENARRDVLIVASESAPQDHARALEAAGAEIVRLPATPRLDPAAVLAILHARNIRSVLLEAGSALNAAFLRANLVDRVVLYFAENKLGPGSLPLTSDDGISAIALQQKLSSITRATFPHDGAEDVRITGYLHDPWADAPLADAPLA